MRYVMRRTRRLAAVLAAALATAVMLGPDPVVAHPAHPAAARQTRPNVLLVVLDDARPEGMAALPQTMAWLADGTAYPNTVAATPSCGPSRATLLSGRYAHNHGVLHQADVDQLDHSQTLQHTLHEAGYGTAAVGKFTNNWALEQTPPGFDHSALVGGGYTNARFMVDGKQRRVPYSTTFIGQQVNNYLDGFEADDAKPWFLYAGFTAPHAPWMPEPQYADRQFDWEPGPAVGEADRSDKPAYVRRHRAGRAAADAIRLGQLRTLLSVDDALTRVRRHLERLGELDDTLVVLVSDNAKFWGEHGLDEKFMPYAAAYRVPLFLSWPGHLPASSDERLASTVDLTPTVLAAAGLTADYVLDGHDLRGDVRREATLLEYWQDSHNGGFPTWASRVAPGERQFTRYVDLAGRLLSQEYYDLAADPGELVNLLGDADPGNDPDVSADAATLAAWQKCAGTTCP
ncbi:sulfatase-like hydrolase/transferase [Catellatospora vulcania]|uniref:sulfatase-like hydrolase/transferase n=1 Tax=Catellatospora vulcania TaxID=1460450 RepID=UPI0012D4074C|nr:sulfatase-like hydrolase/transferase [Catellatospora vulcania]